MQPETTSHVGNEAVITETRASFVEKLKAQFFCACEKENSGKVVPHGKLISVTEAERDRRLIFSRKNYNENLKLI